MKKLSLIAAAALALGVASPSAEAQDAYRCEAVAAGADESYEASGCIVPLEAGARAFHLSWAPTSVGKVQLRLVGDSGAVVGSFACAVAGIDVRDCDAATGELGNGSFTIDTTNVTGGQITVLSTLSEPATLHFTVGTTPVPTMTGTTVPAAAGVFLLQGQ